MKNILLIGEDGIDTFVIGRCPKLSAEAPVPVFHPLRTETNPGMAANVAANIKSLAPDWNVTFFHQTDPIHKIRYTDDMSGQHIVRVDLNDHSNEARVMEQLEELILANDYHAVVVSDYAKGLLTAEIIGRVATLAKEKGIPSFVDTKCLVNEWAKDVTVIKINRKEADAHGEEPWPYSENIIVTEGPKGCYLHERVAPGVLHRVPVKPTEVRSVAGAGDSFAAGLVVSYLEQADSTPQRDRLIRAMAFANKVAAVAVSKRGVVAVRREEVE